MFECCRAAALISNLISELGACLQDYLCAAFCCRRGVCHLYHLGSRPRPCRVLCRRKNCAWVASFFCQLLCLRCGSHSRALSVRYGFPFRCERNPLRPPSCWIVLAVV